MSIQTSMMRIGRGAFSILVSQISASARPLLLLCACCVGIAAVGSSIAFAVGYDPQSFTPEELNAALRVSGPPSQKIYSIRSFYDVDRIALYVTTLSSYGSGWHVTILHRVESGLIVQWRSGKLPDDFSVSSADELTVEYVGDEPVVEFSGCAPHLCGGVDGVVGVLLYSPRSNKAFYAHYRFEEGKPIGSFGTVEFSNNVSSPGNEKYKEALRKALAKALNHGVP